MNLSPTLRAHGTPGEIELAERLMGWVMALSTAADTYRRDAVDYGERAVIARRELRIAEHRGDRAKALVLRHELDRLRNEQRRSNRDAFFATLHSTRFERAYWHLVNVAWERANGAQMGRAA